MRDNIILIVLLILVYIASCWNVKNLHGSTNPLRDGFLFMCLTFAIGAVMFGILEVVRTIFPQDLL